MNVPSFAGKSGLTVYERWSKRYCVETAKKNACKIAEYTEPLKKDGLSDRLTPELSDPFTGGK